jgi:LacI family transcriptional regulator
MRVLEIADQLEYIPKRERKSETAADTKKLNISIIDWYNNEALVEDPYYLSLMSAIEMRCVVLGINTCKTVSINGSFIPTVDFPLDGMVAIGRFNGSEVDQLSQLTPNIVFMDSSPRESEFDSISINARLGISQVLQYLISLGHKRIAFIGGEVVGNNKEPSKDERRETFISVMKECGLYHDKSIFIGKLISYDEGYSAAATMLETDTPTAVIVANDTMAMGVIACLKEKGLEIPADMSVVGFNDLPSVKFTNPPLTTVHVPVDFLADYAVKLLIQRIQGENAFPVKVIVPTVLKIRKSCCKPKR